MLTALLLVTTLAIQADTLPSPTLGLLGEPLSGPALNVEDILVGDVIAQSDAAPLDPASRAVRDLVADGPSEFSSAGVLRLDLPLSNGETVVEARPSFAILAAAPVPLTEFPGRPTHLVELPVALGFARSELDRAIDALEREVRRGAFPGAAIAVGRGDQTVLERGIGSVDGGRFSPPVDPDHTIYDLASLTKVVATTTAVMLLIEDGKMSLDDPVSSYLPRFAGGDKDRVTIRHLLTHTSGLPAGASVAAESPEQSLARALDVPLVRRPGQGVEYSDIGFIVLWAAAETRSDVPIPELLRRRVFEPLGMWSTGFLPGESCVRCAPTLERPGFQGVVHDPTARLLGGVAGSAGLFSTVHDLSRFAAMLASRGELHGVRVLQPATLDLFTQRQPNAGTRALGWDTPDPSGEGAAGLRISPSSFGHTGFTGTSLWVDPDRGTWVVLLTNRTFAPRGPNRMQQLRREINDRVAVSVDLGR